MKNRILLLMAFFIAIQFTYSQTADYKFGIGINFIKNEYNGDYGNGIFDFSKTMYAAGGLSFTYYLNPSFNVGVQGSYGTYGFYADPINNFTGKKLDMSLFGQYKFDNGYILSKASRLSPFISLGVGYASYYQNGTITTNPTIITDGGDLIVPVGAGLKYHVTSRFAIQYQYLYYFTNSDVHDQNRSGGVINTVFDTPAHPASKWGNDAFGEHLFSLVFNFGKLKDTDHDGVADKYDKCPNTPIGVKVDANGCPFDSDGDGVADYLDKCPNTPTGVTVDANGCPFDSDGDGVPDYLDKCPNTPTGVAVDAKGCPFDTDGDGVADYMDKCPNTPAGVKVDVNGCPLDSDGDGVPDYLDKCPDTPAAAYGKVDANGCPTDIDGDGIPDYLDKCPTVPGTIANNGCPGVKKEVKALFKKALQGIQFKTGKSDIKPLSFPLLNQIANILILNPTYYIEVQGHTDNVGGYDYNIDLSNKRAASVRLYLVDKGVNQDKITSKGYGYTKPVADNNTKAGRMMNRRVEFVVTFEK
jgi:outer membrane protein OmpA-like peptidoglycan-associated protein